MNQINKQMGQMYSKNIQNEKYNQREKDNYNERYRQIILDATKIQLLFPGLHKQGYKPNHPWQSDLVLPSTYSYRSSHQIENNALTIIHSTSNQSINNMPKLSQHQYPYSCIGLVLSEHHQNNNTYYVYGTGILIHGNIVLTSAKNVYCRRLNKEYLNIKFITGVSGKKCSAIQDIMRVHYAKEYIKWWKYQNYDFAILQLYEDLSKIYGYAGWKTNYKIQTKENKENIVLGYMHNHKQKSFDLKLLAKYKKLEQNLSICSGSALLKKEGNQYYLVGLYCSQSGGYKILSEVMRSMIKEWTKRSRLSLKQKNLGQKCRQILKYTTSDLREILLSENNISSQGCKYLSQANWRQLTTIDLNFNNIGTSGCKYLIQANWIHLNKIELLSNNIGIQGCKYLSQANWINLTKINLMKNNIKAQGCKYLIQANWKHLRQIYLCENNIGTQGCKYLSQANWTHVTTITLNNNNISAQGCRYLIQANWTHMKQINLTQNNIGAQGCKYLNQANWKYLSFINLYYNSIKNMSYHLLLKQLYPNSNIRL